MRSLAKALQPALTRRGEGARLALVAVALVAVAELSQDLLRNRYHGYGG